MNGRTVLITGGMGGIGTVMSQYLHDQGYKVGTTYVHNSGREERWLEQQKTAGYPDFEVFYCNVSDFADCERLKGEVAKRMGKIDCLVNMAGITRDNLMIKMPAEDWTEVINTNLSSVFNVTKQFVGDMIANKFGRIVNISSVNGAKGQRGQTNYSAAKAGMHGFTKSLAQEVVRKGITVNTIAPGYIATSLIMKIREDVREKIRESIPMQRFGEPDEVARTVAFLIDDKAGYITGAELHINGGLYMV